MIIFSFNPLNRHILTTENSKLANSSSFDTKGFEISFGNSMQDNRDVSNLADKEPSFRNNLETTLRISYALVSIQTLETGKSCLALLFFQTPEEMVKSIIYPLADVLQGLAMHRNIKILSELVQVKLRERSFVFLVGINLGFKKIVIDKTAVRKSLIKSINLLLAWVYSVSEIHLHNHLIFNIHTFKYFSVIPT